LPLAYLAGVATDSLIRIRLGCGRNPQTARAVLAVLLFAALPTLLRVALALQANPAPFWPSSSRTGPSSRSAC